MVRGARERVCGLNQLKRIVYLISPSKIKKNLGWKHEYDFESMLDEMNSHWFGELTKDKYGKL